MRILNRPMFRYGGPIKEGGMHGMRDGGRAALVGNPIFPKTAGREHHEIDYRFNPKKIKSKIVVGGIKEGVKRYAPKLEGIGGRTFGNLKNWWARHKPTAKFRYPSVTPHPGASFKYAPRPYSKLEIAKNPKLWGQAIKENPYWAAAAGYGSVTDPGRAVIGGVPGALKWGAEALTPGFAEKYLPWKDKDDGGDDGTGTGTGVGAGAQFKESTAPELTASQRDKLAKDAQNKRLKSYLDMMGYDSAKKGALSDALIDASALVQDATTEAGSLKKADWGKLINRMIQTTSKRLDKPEQIREAVGLMMTKGEIEKDLLQAKGGSLKQNARDLVAAGVYKTEKEAMAHLGKKADFEEVVGALSAKKDVDGSVLADAWRISGEGIPTEQVKGSNKYYKKFKEAKEDEGKGTNIELAFVDEEIEDKKAGDVYVIDDRMIIVQEDGTLKYRW